MSRKRSLSLLSSCSSPKHSRLDLPRRFWLIKSEPEGDSRFSIDDLEQCTDSTTSWDGVRNYQARNLLREMRLDDLAFFYHSNCRDPGIVAIVRVVREAYPDWTAFRDPKNPKFDPKSSEENPRWFMVDVRLEMRLENLISLRKLKELRANGETCLKNMVLLSKGRLSVQPVSPEEWEFICNLANVPKELSSEKGKL